MIWEEKSWDGLLRMEQIKSTDISKTGVYVEIMADEAGREV